jgi:hypothetical protein
MKHNLKSFWNLHRVSIMLTLISLAFYGVFAYDLNRSDSIKLLSLLAALTLLFIKLLQFEKFNFKFLTLAGILFRLVFWFATPNLSPDYFRFIWDGQVLLSGTNPYLFTPNQWMSGAATAFPLASTLFAGMSELSAQHFSNYPPINQYLFAIGAFFGGSSLGGNIIALRAITLTADIGILVIGRKLLRKLNKAPHLIFWYFLNPMIIIELTGNLHFEGVMILFFLLGFLMLSKGKILRGALFIALSIGTKLIPLLFLPLILPWLGLRKSIPFYIGLFVILSAVCLPLLATEIISNYLNTIGLWFSNFEFNAGLYNIAEKLANLLGIPSWKFIKQYGSAVPWVTAGSAVLLALHPKMLNTRYWFNGALALLTVYFSTAAVMHPWYLTFPLILCLFTRWRYPIWWSVFAMVSYTAYSNTEVEEKSFWLIIEYTVVFGVLAYEFFNVRKQIVTDFKKSSN